MKTRILATRAALGFLRRLLIHGYFVASYFLYVGILILFIMKALCGMISYMFFFYYYRCQGSALNFWCYGLFGFNFRHALSP